MWIMIIAMTLTIILFWRKISFPVEKCKNTKMYTIIIPARNEAENLHRLLPSLIASPSPLREVIVVDDDSDDETKKVAESYGVKVVANPSLPVGWMGKSWACYNGAKKASGQTLMFLDADTWFVGGGADCLIQLYELKGSDAVMTIHPYHKMRSFWEKLSSVFHLVVFASSGITSILNSEKGGFGPCLMIDKETYWNLDGHQAIRSEIVEHLAFVRRAAANGLPTYAYSGRGVLDMRMYEANIKSVIRGWGKSFATGATTASPLLSLLNIFWITAMVSFLINLPDAGWLGVLGYLFFVVWLYRTLIEIGSFRWYDVVIFPVHFFFFVIVFAYSFVNAFFLKQTTWKGRSIINKKRRSS